MASSNCREVDIIHRPGSIVVPITGVHTGNRHHIGHPQRVPRQEVGLQGQPVAITAANLHHGLETFLLQQRTPPKGAHPHDRVAHFRHDKGIHPTLYANGMSHHGSEVDALGRLHLGQDQELPRGQFF